MPGARYEDKLDLIWHPWVYQALDVLLPVFSDRLAQPPGHEWTEDYPLCGDGRLQADEDCECSQAGCYFLSSEPVEPYRKHFCCQEKACKLTMGKKCGSGGCCDLAKCEPFPADQQTVCRPAQNQCDQPEKCAGLAHCPDDLFYWEGTSCGQHRRVLGDQLVLQARHRA